MNRTLTLQERLARLSPAQRAMIAQRVSPKNGAGLPSRRQPAIDVPASDRFEPFPLMDLQEAYWIGRNAAFQLGGVASHSYFEIEGVDLDLEKLEVALRLVIDRHDSLRMIVTPDGQQRVVPEVPPYRIEPIDLRDVDAAVVDARLSALRDELSHQVRPADRWPLFEIRAALLPEDRMRLLVSFDGLVVDGWSLMLFFREWATLYERPESVLPKLRTTFRDYVLAERRLGDEDAVRKARDYWLARMDTLPLAPTLPSRRGPAEDAPRFMRRQRTLAPSVWAKLKMRASRAGLTPTVALLAAYVDVLALWSDHPHFCINVPRFNRQPRHPDVPHLIGEFASFTILEANARPDLVFPERALAIQEQLWRDLAHAEFGGVRVLRELARRRGGAAIIPVVFTAAPEHPSHKNSTLAGEARRLGEVVYAINQTPQVWLDNHVAEVDGALICDWDSVDAMFPDRVPADLLDAYMRHLGRLAATDAAWTEDHRATSRILIPDYQLALRRQINGVRRAIPECLVHDGFTARAEAAPEATAVIAAGRTLRYGELQRLASRWAHEIHRRQDPGRPVVAIIMEKGWEQIVAALAVVQAGLAYVPIDPRVPPQRLHDLLERADARIALTQSRLLPALDWPSTITPLPVDTMVPQGEDVELPRPSPENLCYLLYTSGSSGTPKGVMIAHRGVVNALRETEQRFAIGPSDRVLALTALHHDMSVFDIFGVLGAGGTLIMPSADLSREPAHWLDLLREHRATVWNSVPAMMEMLVEHAGGREIELPSLRLAFLGGDWIPLGLPRRLAALAPNAQIVSVGGPTETTLWNIWYPLEQVDPEWTSIPYGKPIANTQYFILNDALEDCPTWVVGEQYCAGVGVANGYWRDDETTTAKFVRHPATGERIYRTGDLGRYLPDGTIEFVGRADLQVKINGQRIELGEIESTLGKHPSISSAVVIAAGEPRGRKRIVAYVVQGVPRATEEDLRAFVARQLPDHMIPSAIVTLDVLPVTANGKIDRQKLAEREIRAADAPKITRISAVATSVVTRVTNIVTRILGLDQLDPDASLVACGANSIDMVRIGNQLDEAFGSRPRIDELFRLDSVAALANFYNDQVASETSAPSIVASRDLTAIIDSYPQMLDPEAREAFKKSRPGVRRADPGRGAINLVKPDPASWLEGFRRRRSNRSFSLRPVGFTAFSEMLACLMEITLDGRAKRLHGSPGGLNPIQVYLHVKPGRVEGVEAGTYYYHPVNHCLISLTRNVDLDRDIHIPFINTPVFDRAAFSVFLIADLSAIAPSYGHYSLHFSTIEAGLIAQTLELMAPACGIGFCQIGSVQFDRIRSLFLLDRPHVLIHSLVGGLVDDRSSAATVDPSPSSRSVIEDTLGRLQELSDDEVRQLLEANRRVNDPRTPATSATDPHQGA